MKALKEYRSQELIKILKDDYIPISMVKELLCEILQRIHDEIKFESSEPCIVMRDEIIVPFNRALEVANRITGCRCVEYTFVTDIKGHMNRDSVLMCAMTMRGDHPCLYCREGGNKEEFKEYCHQHISPSIKCGGGSEWMSGIKE